MSKPKKAAKTPQKPARQPIAFAILAAVFVGIIIYVSNFTNFKDFFLAAAYHPSSSVSALETKLELSDAATLIFHASQPELHSTDFTEYCESSDPSRSILGCYSDRRIHVYQIQSEELSGIVESTTAHELLHAIWERLPGREKDELLSLLNQVYKDNYEQLKIVAEYPQNSQATELYARVGSEINTLPAELESHYAKYFQNRAQIVAFYQNYSDTFAALNAALQDSLAEIDRLEISIDEQKANYSARSSAFSSAVTEFNNCAALAGCFASESNFSARRQELLAEQKAIQQLFATLNSDIDRYNELVELYNSSLLRQRKLVKIINPSQEEGEQINE